MNLNIEKITNGYVVSIDGKKTFCDVPEAICGLMAEWIQDHCRAVEAMRQFVQAPWAGDSAKWLTAV